MQVAINLTPVLVTLIICVFLYAMCKMARKDNQEKQTEYIPKKEYSEPLTIVKGQGRSTQELHLREYVEDQVKKGECKE